MKVFSIASLLFAFPQSASFVIGSATWIEIVRRPLFWAIAAIAALAIFPVSYFLPYNTLGEDVKMVMDLGLSILLASGLGVALFAASVSIADEIEGKTAITLLSKPIGRRSFIIGKFLGIMGAVLLLFLLVGVVFLTTIYFKIGHDAREGAMDVPNAQQRFETVVRIVPGIVLAYFQVTILCAISVALSTRLPIFLNVIACISLYLAGHLSLVVVEAAETNKQFEGVAFVANAFKTVLPCLELFNSGSAIATDARIGLDYLAWALLYCGLYTGVALFAALLMFEDRDLA